MEEAKTFFMSYATELAVALGIDFSALREKPALIGEKIYSSASDSSAPSSDWVNCLSPSPS
jgi:hypothetical protein